MDYFRDIFTKPQPQLDMDTWDGWSHFDNHLSEVHSHWLNRPFTSDEVKTAAFQIGGTKAPGSDGFLGCFYHHHWDIIGPSICSAVLAFLNSGYPLKEVNHSHIALISKVPSPTSLSDYCPINLCNVLYKITSKTLANRLKHILHSYISQHKMPLFMGAS